MLSQYHIALIVLWMFIARDKGMTLDYLLVYLLFATPLWTN